MRSFSRSAVRARRQVPGDDSRGWVRILLACGLPASLLYGGMIWVIRFEGYSPLSQTVSELSAWGVSTRPSWTVLGTLWDAMMIAFAVGVLASAGRRGVLRIVGGLLLAYGLLGLAWPLVSMHPRDVLAAGGATLADTGHLVLVGATGVVMVAAMAFGAAAFGRLFRVYSIATIVVLLVCGAMTGADKSRIEANLSTPWAGLWERINIGFTLLWVAVLAVVLLRTSRETPSDRPAPHDLIRVRRAPPREARRQPARIEQPPAS